MGDIGEQNVCIFIICHDACFLHYHFYYFVFFYCTVAPNCEANVQLTISASKPRHIEQFLYCHIQHCDEPIALHVVADVTVALFLILNFYTQYHSISSKWPQMCSMSFS